MSFRPLRRTKNAIPLDSAKDLMEKERRGVLAVNGDDGYPFAIPVNFYYDRAAGKIYLHGSKVGHKVDALKRCDKVCFTVYGNEQYKDSDWAPYMQSAVAFGRCKLLEPSEETSAKLRKLAMKYYPTLELVEEEIGRSSAAVQMYEITIEHLCGKQIQEN